MAQNRTFQFMGNGFGPSPVSVTATINGTEVFSGPIPTLNQTPTQDPTGQVVLFSIDNSADLSTDFAGTVPMTVVVTGGIANFGEIKCNYYQGNVVGDPKAGTADGFDSCTSVQPEIHPRDWVAPDPSTIVQDPRSGVVINGVPQEVTRPPNGCYNYIVPPGSTMTYTFTTLVGQVGNVLGNVANYTGSYTTV